MARAELARWIFRGRDLDRFPSGHGICIPCTGMAKANLFLAVPLAIVIFASLSTPYAVGKTTCGTPSCFKFVSGFDFNDERFAESLRTSGPKNWEESELEIIGNLLPNLESKVPALMAKAKKLGMNRFARWKGRAVPQKTRQGVKWTRDDGYTASASSYFRALFIYDAFFSMSLPDPGETWYESQEYILVHELVHVADQSSEISHSSQFLKLAGFTSDGAGSYKLKHVDQKKQETVFKAVNDLRLQHRYLEAERIEKQFTEPLGFPSLYAMESPVEALAEFAAHVVYDSRAGEYMKPEIITFIRNQILKPATAKGFPAKNRRSSSKAD